MLYLIVKIIGALIIGTAITFVIDFFMSWGMVTAVNATFHTVLGVFPFFWIVYMTTIIIAVPVGAVVRSNRK
jgi:hypothetical protein